HRATLVASWDIAPGSTVLELGCGQGDMTAVLAEAVGPEGRVVAIDVADPSYGSPVTLGESADRLAAGPLGPRIDFRFGTDVLDPSVDFPVGSFDHVVLAHCSWYFASLGQLRDTLARVRRWAGRLWFTEWDVTPTSGDQLAHLLAVLIQGQIEAAGSRGQGNVRTPFSREELLRLLPEAGWTAEGSRPVDTEGLQ
ncbi:class I SAM-dependent methyltransferase, partial [Streptomyces sp. SID7982]|nr:class I SAM-dependent methyltransferase [Streptomyces sp. SID7982]